MRKGFLLFCLLVCLFAASCGEGTSPDVSCLSSDHSEPEVVSEPSAIGKPTVSEPADENSFTEESGPADESSSSEGVPLPPEETLSVYPGLRFRLPEGWGTDAASAPETLFFASAADGSASVSAAYTALETTQGLTEALLIEEFRGSLTVAWEDAGATGVAATSVSVSLLGESHEALSLTAIMDGKTVCQLQIYLLQGDGLYTLTVTAGGPENAKALLASLEAE